MATRVRVSPSCSTAFKDHARPHIAWTNYLGFWRAAVVIDFGKDLPVFSESLHELPNREFVRALAEAFRGPVVEVGEFY